MGTWKSLANQPVKEDVPFNAGTMLLLTDGTVMCHDRGAGGSPRWYLLAPDQVGSYFNGAWSRLADAPNSPLFFASAVLKDGRVFVAGGEYSDGMNWDLLTAQVYNPLSDLWSVASLPPEWPNIGDAPGCLLPDGRFLMGSIKDNRTAIYNPIDNTWAPAGVKQNVNSNEETWTLLPDETILSVDCNGHPGAQKYIIGKQQWIRIGDTLSDLVEDDSIEIGPAILLPDKRVFAIGATGHTALYVVPAQPDDPGEWKNGPDIPPQNKQTIGAKDAPACLLPNGKVLCVASPVNGKRDDYLSPMYFFEFDPVKESLALIEGPPSNPQNLAAYSACFLPLPSGEILFSNGTREISLYQPDGGPDPSWRPVVTSLKLKRGPEGRALKPNQTYVISGRQLNGLSQAASYGDDAQMATNYPLVRIHKKASNRVTYCRTQNHSTMGVATGNAEHSTEFSVPAAVELGPSELIVIANGIASEPLEVTVEPDSVAS